LSDARDGLVVDFEVTCFAPSRAGWRQTNEGGFERYAPLTGVIAVVLWVARIPDDKVPSAEIAA
jgi:hypothetical protein